MPEPIEIRLRDIFRVEKYVFIDDLGLTVGFLIHYHQEIIELAKEYGVTLMLHKPRPIFLR